MISANDALRIILQEIEPGPKESCRLDDSLGRILAENVIAPSDVPPFDNSSMDGFAVRSNDVQSAGPGAGISLTLQGEISAGQNSPVDLLPHHTLQIMTGAPVPNGADTIVEIELTGARNGSVEILTDARAGRNIRRRGEDIKAGSKVLSQGMRLTPARRGILASLGISSVPVYRRPNAAVLSSGDEVVDVDVQPSPGQIRNSNAYTLDGLLHESGCDVTHLGIVRDNREDMKKRVADGLRCDALVTSGGASVGKHDHMLEVLKASGVEIKFWKVNMKPGMPMAFGIVKAVDNRSVPVFVLPGNPVSTVVTFHVIARPGLLRLAGAVNQDEPVRLMAVLDQDIPKKDGKRHFVRGIHRNDGTILHVRTTGSQSSGVLTSLSTATCLIVVPEEARELKAGTPVEIELL